MQNTVKLYGVVEGYEKISFVLDKFNVCSLMQILYQEALLFSLSTRDLF